MKELPEVNASFEDLYRMLLGPIRYDLVRASATLNFARDDMDSMIAKIYDALNPGGVFITYSEGLTHERTKPDTHVLSMMSLSLRVRICTLIRERSLIRCLRSGFGQFVHARWIRIGVRWISILAGRYEQT